MEIQKETKQKTPEERRSAAKKRYEEQYQKALLYEARRVETLRILNVVKDRLLLIAQELRDEKRR